MKKVVRLTEQEFTKLLKHILSGVLGKDELKTSPEKDRVEE